ncbi:polysaccharide biosynthesis tyrosine autokinase [Microlunatus sp. Y2014]|uniref:polysaccharide biosynthesis tyrosine autokinase n=1 Tax=Microlunatus sp. Y2014 TaxID=3418488 RepID=UPI003DA76BB6
MDADTVVRLIRMHWITILVLALLGGVGGFGLARVLPKEYEAQAQVIVVVANTESTGDLPQISTYAQEQARNFSVLATREMVLQPVIDQLELDLTVAQLRRRVATNVPLNTSLITITVTDGSPTRAADVANAMSRSLTRAVREIAPRVDESPTSPVSLQVIESAVPPLTASAPSGWLFTFLGLLAGLLASAVVVLVRELIGPRVRTVAQLQDLTGASVLGSIAYDRTAPKRPIAVTADPHSARAEEVRQIRLALRYLQTDRPHKMFAFTSATAQEGKSSVSANVAAAMAASGLRVCLVEGDLRRPTLGTVLDLVGGIGLTTVVAGEAELDHVLQEWGTDGLQVLLAGDVPPNPGEIIESARVEQLLQRIRERFDVTIIDCPPIHPAADAVALVSVAGGAVLVAGAKRVRVRDFRRAVQRLRVVDTPIVGTILNLADGARQSVARYAPHGSEPSPRRPSHTEASQRVEPDPLHAAPATGPVGAPTRTP